MAVRRIYTPESLVLRHEEILPNANFMACMIRAELQASSRSGDVPVPLGAITRGRTESNVTADDEAKSDREENNVDEDESSKRNVSNAERNPFIVTTTNQASTDVTDEMDAGVKDSEDAAFTETDNSQQAILRETNSLENVDRETNSLEIIDRDMIRKNQSGEDTSKDFTPDSEIPGTRQNRDPQESDDAYVEENFAQNIDLSPVRNEDGIASFPREDLLRSSVRKLPPLDPNDETRNRKNVAAIADEMKSNGISKKPVYGRSESRVHFKL